MAVSAPSDLESRYSLAPVDLAGEIGRARESLAGIEVAVLGKDEPLTLDRLDQRLRKGVDILYLVCHGALADRQQTYLFLQDESGAVQRVHGDDLALRVSEMLQPPRLAVLASCETAGTGQAAGASQEKVSVQASLAPRLADGGVAAVLAMQGQVISTETVQGAMPVFFSELLQDGQIDRAMARARGAVRKRDDAWMPALFLRLRGGRIQYEPGFGAGEDDAVKWKALVNDIENKRFTPVVGWGLAERIYDSTGDLAQRLAMTNHFPLAPCQRTDLPQVSQYLLVNQSSSRYPLDAVKEQMRREIYTRHRDVLLPEHEEAPLSKLLKKTSAILRQDEQDVYRILARLPAKVFVIATPDTLLTQALIEAGKSPEERFAFWKRDLEPPEPYEQEPTVAEPLVYHMFGHFKEPDSLVLTEDDYFDYLIGASRNKALVPNVVRHALTNSSLMFLGFQLTDWSFRVLFRLIMSHEGAARRQRFPQAAVQVDPEGSQMVDLEQARKYLEDYYGGENISLFWGGGEEFLRQLRPRLPDRAPEEWDRHGGDTDDF